VKENSSVPRRIFTYRPLRLSLATVMEREGNQGKCEAWRLHFDKKAAAAAPAPAARFARAAPADDDFEERKESDLGAAAAAAAPMAVNPADGMPSAEALLRAARRKPDSGGSAAESVEPFISLVSALRRKCRPPAQPSLEEAQRVLQEHLHTHQVRSNTQLNDVYDGQLWRDMQYWRPNSESAGGIHNDWLPDDMRRAYKSPVRPPESVDPELLGHDIDCERPDSDVEADEASLAESSSTVRQQWEDRLRAARQHEEKAWQARVEQDAAKEESRRQWPYTGALLAQPHTLALQLFVDWYQKHDQGHHSVGLIWACVLNLPREERYELHNMLLVGVLPGPQESSYAQVQGALKVLTAELQQLWVEGLQVGSVRHRVFLFSVVCDTPAMRSVCGLGRESAVYGCPYCDGSFPRRPGGTHRDWRPSVTMRDGQLMHPPHTHATRRRNAMEWLRGHKHMTGAAWAPDTLEKFLTKHVFTKPPAPKPKDPATADCRPKQTKQGVAEPAAASAASAAAAEAVPHSRSARWSALLDLPHLDIVRSVPIDVMHNLLLGLCKHVMSVLTGHHDKQRTKASSKKEEAAAAAAAREEEACEEGKEDSDEEASTTDSEAGEEDGNHAEEKEDEQETQRQQEEEQREEQASCAARPGEKRQRAVAGAAGQRGAACAPPPPKRARTAAATSAAVFSAGAASAPPARALAVRRSSAAVLTNADLAALQRCVAACNTPRDIGRMTSRLDKPNNIKAVEWLNLFATFLVPFVRDRMPGHKHLRMEHLTLVERVASIVRMVSSYYTTPHMIEQLHQQLVQVMLDMEQLGPDISSYIKPNMHLSLHLSAQLRDHGPASSWWTFPYERLMGVASNTPFKPGSSSVDTAMRLLTLLEVTAQATPAQLEQRSRCGRFGVRLPPGPGFEHGVRRTDHGGHSHWFRFVGELADRAARRLHMHRVLRSDFTVRGCERYPGVLFNSGQLFKQDGGRVRSVGLDSDRIISTAVNDADFTAAVAALQLGTRSALKALRAARQRQPTLHTLGFVRLCLLAHHVTTRCSEVQAVYQTAIKAAPRNQLRQLKAEQSLFMDPQTQRTDVFNKLLHARGHVPRPAKDYAWLAHADAPTADYHTMLQWYREQCGGTAAEQWDRVDIYDKLLYAGEEFGSDIASEGKNAWISANFHWDAAERVNFEKARTRALKAGKPAPQRPPSDESETAVWYGRVCYYVRHTFAGRPHDFAVVRWFDFAEPKLFDRLATQSPEQWPAAIMSQQGLQSAAAREHGPLAALRSTLHDYPIVNVKPIDPDIRDIIPVHRITGRWISMAPEEGQLQYVCPIRSRLHG